MKIIDRIKGNDFFKDTFIVSAGTFLSQLISILLYPVLARVFSAEDFGLLAMITSGTTILSISSLKYENAIILTKNKKDSINVASLSVIVSFIILVFLTVSFFILTHVVDLQIDNYKFLYIVPILSLCLSIFNSYNEWCVKYKLFKNLSKNKILSSIFTTIPKLSLGVFNVNFGLIIGEIIGRILTALIGVIYFLRYEFENVRLISLQKFKSLAKEFIDFPKYIFPGQLLSTLSGQLPIFFIGYFFSVKDVGYYNMAFTLILIPATLVSSSIRDVFRQRAMNDIEQTGLCFKLYIKTLLILSIISISGFAILFIFLPFIIDIFLGSQWLPTVHYARLLIPFVSVSFISDVLGSIYILTNNQRNEALWQFLNLLATILTMFVAFFFKTMESFLIAYSVSKISIYLLNIYWTYKIAFSYGKTMS